MMRAESGRQSGKRNDGIAPADANDVRAEAAFSKGAALQEQHDVSQMEGADSQGAALQEQHDVSQTEGVDSQVSEKQEADAEDATLVVGGSPIETDQREEELGPLQEPLVLQEEGERHPTPQSSTGGLSSEMDGLGHAQKFSPEIDGSTGTTSDNKPCCEHRRRRAVKENACSSSKAPESWKCESDFQSAGVCGCFGGFGSGQKTECAWCGKDVLHGDLGDGECDFVDVKMHMTQCKKDATLVKETAAWFSGWEHYILCEHGHVATGPNATCGRSGGGHFSGYHQRWFTNDCNTIYIFYYNGDKAVTNAFSILTHLGERWRFKHEHWLHSSYIECDAISA
jgi:hypothetical protein